MQARAAIRIILGFLSLFSIAAGRAQFTQEMTTGTDETSYPIPGSHLLQKQEEAVRQFLAQHPDILRQAKLQKIAAWNFNVGDTHAWYADKFTDNSRYLVPSTCRAVGPNCYIFVEDSSWAHGRVNQTAVDSVEHAFDLRTPASSTKGVFLTDVESFGNPPDIDSDPRIVILLLDIIDGYSGSGGFIAGYFTSYNEIPKTAPGYSTSNQAEIYFLDVNPANLVSSSGLQQAMATTAHEFQHMIHFNYDPSEITFLNESFSEVAPVLCGYPIRSQSGYVNETNHYLFDWRYNDNTAVLRDYSRASRFSVYFSDQFGSAVFKPIVSSTQHGTAGIDAGLAALTPATSRRFATIFQDWLIANTLNDRSVDTRYGYVYPGLARAAGKTYTNPNVGPITDTVHNLGAQYYFFTSGSQLHATFSSTSSGLVIKAIELGPSSKRVLDVTPGVQFNEPLFGTTYTEVRFVVINTNTTSNAVHTLVASGSTTTDVTGPGTTPAAFRLEQNYPNPFNPATVIRYQLPAATSVNLAVYDLLGREVALLVNEKKPAGSYVVQFSAKGGSASGGDGSRLSSGVYIYRLSAGQYVESRRMVLVR